MIQPARKRFPSVSHLLPNDLCCSFFWGISNSCAALSGRSPAHMDEQRSAGQEPKAGEGRFHPVELPLILLPTWLALSCFLVGFVFLGRVAFHF